MIKKTGAVFIIVPFFSGIRVYICSIKVSDKDRKNKNKRSETYREKARIFVISK